MTEDSINLNVEPGGVGTFLIGKSFENFTVYNIKAPE